MTKHEAAIVSAFTGYMLGSFDDMHEYVEKLMGYPVFTHTFANPDFVAALKEAARKDFVALKVE